MYSFTSTPLAPPRLDGDTIRAGLRRHTKDQYYQDCINPDGVNGAVVGPPGFCLWQLTPEREPTLRCAPQHHHRLLVVQRGAVMVSMGPERALERLGLRDTLLLPPDTEHQIVPIDEGSRIIGLDYQERNSEGQLITGGRKRSGLARYSLLRPIRERFPMRLAPKILNILSPRDLYLIAGPIRRGPSRAEIFGPRGMTVALAHPPRFTGPALHVHTLSVEIFLNLEGRFRVTWGDRGEHEEYLEPGDILTIPPGVNRSFEAVGNRENWLMPIVMGADDESKDIVWLPEVAQQLARTESSLTALVTRALLRFAPRAS